MYANVIKYVKVDNKCVEYVEIYADSLEEAKTIPATKYLTGTKMYIVPTGEMYIACSSGWYDVDGTVLT